MRMTTTWTSEGWGRPPWPEPLRACRAQVEHCSPCRPRSAEPPSLAVSFPPAWAVVGPHRMGAQRRLSLAT